MNIETIISSLESAENDNKRFALLLILSELIKSKKLDFLKLNEQTDEDETKKIKALNERLFHSINPNFLARLLTTKQTTENFSPLVYKSVSLSIITQFMDYESLICDPVLLSKLDIFCNILILKDFEKGIEMPKDDGQVKLENSIISDCFKYIYALSNYIPDHLCQSADLLDILVNKIILNEDYPYAKKTINTVLKNNHEENDFRLIACKLFSNLCKDNGLHNKYSKYKIEKIEKILKSFLNTINENQSQFKFCLIHYLNLFLEDTNINQYFKNENLNEVSSNIIYNILNNLFKSKLNKEIKQLAFILLNNFIKNYQFEYIYMKNRNFFYLIIHLLSIEIGLSLNSTSRETISDELIDHMSIYYSLMEEIIIILSTASPFETNKSSSEEDEYSDEDDVANSNHSGDEEEGEEPEFKRVIKVIVEVLETIILFIKDNLANYEKLNQNECVLVISSIRLLNCWLSHENLLEDELIQLMPQIIKFCDYHYSDSSNKGLNINVYEFIVPALQRVLIDQKDALQLKTSEKKNTDDTVKFEFEANEINQKINMVTDLLEKCYTNESLINCLKNNA